MDTNQYLEIFIEESKEHLQSVNENLLLLENNPEDTTIVNEVFRSAHTLKGMSATMGYEDLANLTHQMENVLDGIRNQQISVTPSILDVVFLAVDDLEAMIESIATGGDGKRDVTYVVQQLEHIEKGKSSSTAAHTNADVKSGNSEGETTPQIYYDEFELTVLQQSKEQGYEVYEITISLAKDCLLKAARVFMVFEVLDKSGEVIKAVPSVEQLEEEQFDSHFTVTYVSRESKDDIRKKINKISEIEEVMIHILSLEGVRHQQDQVAELNLKQNLVTGNEGPEKIEPAKKGSKTTSPRSISSSSKTIRVNIERLDILMNLFEELVIDRGRLEQISADLNHPELQETVERMSRISGDLQNIILNMRMVPVETVFNRFPRMVRQLARELNKKINLEIIGAETELDRTVIDEIGDPLVHLLRNALDHGIETPEERIAHDKPAEGTVKLKAYHSGNHVFIEIEDDGAGISREKVLQKALANDLVSPQQAETLTDKQIYELILASGFSTAKEVSDVSGRGVGLDVVKNTIESLGGSISIDSMEGQGSVFSIQLPLTLSIISVMLVEIQREKFAIPLSSIIETAIVNKADIFSAHNQKVVDFRGKIVPLIHLKEIFEVPEYETEDELYSVVIIRKGEKMAGLVVDSFIGQQEIVLKSLGHYLTNVFAISGATILGNGQVALIIDCNALII